MEGGTEMTTQEAIETFGRLKHYIQTDVNRYGGGWDSIVEAIDTVVSELEKPLPTDDEIEAYAIENVLDDDTVMAFNKMKRWIEGARWMRNFMKKRVAKSDFLKSANDISEVTHPYDLSKRRAK